MTPTLYPPVVSQGARDRRLSLLDRASLLVLWQELSPAVYQPMKAEALGLLMGVRRQSAARVLRRLIETGYLLEHRRGPRDPREFLLVNHNPLPPASLLPRGRPPSAERNAT